MKAAVISAGAVSSKMQIEEMRKLFDKVDDIPIKKIEMNLTNGRYDVLVEGKPMEKYDCVYVKGSFRYIATQVGISLSLLREGTYVPLSPMSFLVCHDKLLTQLEVQKHNIPMPVSYLAASGESGKAILQRINYPIVMKFPQGTHGKGVMFADSYNAAVSLLDAMDALNQPIIIQEYIETNGSDIRVIVVGDKVVASMRRKAILGEKRSNIHAGGTGESIVLDDYTAKIAVRTAKAMGMDIAGIDILETSKGPYVLEVNASPGLQGITKATGINVAEKIAKHLYKKTKALKEQNTKAQTEEIMTDLGIEDAQGAKEIVSTLDFRGNRILLPEIMTKLSNLSEDDEVVIRVEKGKVFVEKHK
jgi:ribosomal protein S6--L-glutamate ligase